MPQGASEEHVLSRSEGEWVDLHHYDLYDADAGGGPHDGAEEGGGEDGGARAARGATMPCDDVTGRPTRIDRLFGALNYLVPVSMTRLGMQPIAHSAILAADASASTATATASTASTPSTLPAASATGDTGTTHAHEEGAAQGVAHDEGKRRRVRFRLPADDEAAAAAAANATERPSDHFGLMVRFAVR